MSSGRSDYWYRMIPGRSVLGDGQTGILKVGAESVTKDEFETHLRYTVPNGYIFYLNSWCVSCRIPGIMIVSIYSDEDLINIAYIDGLGFFPMSEGAAIEVLQNKEVTIKIFNTDKDIDAPCFSFISGFIQKIS